MDAELLHYTSGEEVQLGDRVLFDGTLATVVAVSDGENYQLAPGFEDYAGLDRGLLICDDDGTRTNVDDTDFRLRFVDRGTA